MIRPLFLVLAAATTASVVDDYPKNPHIDIERYVFDLTLNDTNDRVVGSATIVARFLADSITTLRLDLISAGYDSAGRGMTVSHVTSGGRALAFTHADDVLLVSIPSTTAGQRQSVTVSYTGVAATGLVIGPNKHGDRTFFSDNWPNKARHWLPTVDHPYDKAMSEMIVTAPAHYQVVSNGLLIETTDVGAGMRRTHWRQSVPIATWLYVLGVARFAVQHVDDYQGKAIQTWVYPQDREAGFYDFAVPTKDVMEFYGDRVGPYAYEKLANIQSNSVGGGMEAATAIFYGDNSVTGTREARWRNVIIHEVAHQWFGNAVTEYDWDDVWLSEGFATYFTLLYIEHAYGRDEFVRGLERSRDRIFRFYAERPDYRIVHDDLTDMGQVTTGMTYQKGAWTLHMLRGLVGTEAFWKGIRTYYARHFNGNASTDDFRRAMEEASGMDLEGLFQQWLYQGGVPTIDGGWRYDADRGVVTVELAQVQPDYQFAMPVDLAIHIGDGPPQVERVRIEGRSHTFEFSVEDQPTEVVLDPQTWLLMEATFVRWE
jgi:aminopeptidase N